MSPPGIEPGTSRTRGEQSATRPRAAADITGEARQTGMPFPDTNPASAMTADPGGNCLVMVVTRLNETRNCVFRMTLNAQAALQ